MIRVVAGRRRGARRHDLRVSRLQIGQSPFDDELAIDVPVQGFNDILNLNLQVLHLLQIAGSLRWKLPRVAQAVLFEPFFLFDQAAPRVFELHGQELTRPLREDFAVAQILVNEVRRESVGDSHDGHRVVADERDAKRVSLERVDADVAELGHIGLAV